MKKQKNEKCIQTSYSIPATLRRRLKIRCAQDDVDQSEVVRAGIEAWLNKRADERAKMLSPEERQKGPIASVYQMLDIIMADEKLRPLAELHLESLLEFRRREKESDKMIEARKGA